MTTIKTYCMGMGIALLASAYAQPANSQLRQTTQTKQTKQTKQTTALKSSPTQKTISKSGLRTLTFGQTVNKAALTKAGFAYPKDANPFCYYVTVSPAIDDQHEPNFLLIEDNKLGLMALSNNALQVFSGVKIGDSVNNVIHAHASKPTYSVDKYDDGSGNDYHLTYTLDNGNQIDYRMVGGKKMAHTTIAPKDWQEKHTMALTGSVRQIAVGVPAAIALVEGCS